MGAGSGAGAVAGDSALDRPVVAPRHQPDPLGRVPAAGQHRGDHRLRPEQRLHPHQRAPGPLVGLPDVAPQPAAAAPRPRPSPPAPAAARPARPTPRTRCRRGRSQPGVELPAHPVDRAGRGERLRAPPDPLQLLPGAGARADPEPGARQPVAGQRARAAARPARGRRTRRRRPGRPADPAPARRPAPRADARRTGGRGSRPRASRCASTASAPNRDATSAAVSARERAQAAQPQPAQQVDQLGPVDRRARGPARSTSSGARNAGVSPGATATPAAGGEHRGEQPVGHPDLALHPGARGHLVDQPLGGRQLAAEVAGRALARAAPAGPAAPPPPPAPAPRPPRTTGSNARASRSGSRGEHGQLGAPGLGLAAAQPAPHPVRRGPTAEHASTRFATNTAAGRCGGTCAARAAAVTGQSGTQRRAPARAPLSHRGSPPGPANRRSDRSGSAGCGGSAREPPGRTHVMPDARDEPDGGSDHEDPRWCPSHACCPHPATRIGASRRHALHPRARPSLGAGQEQARLPERARRSRARRGAPRWRRTATGRGRR